MRLVDSFMAPKNILQGFADLAEEENVDPFIHSFSKGLLLYNNVSNVSRFPVRLVDSFTAPKDILQSLQILQWKKITIHSFYKGSFENVSRLASKVGKLTYSTKRHSSGVCQFHRGRKC